MTKRAKTVAELRKEIDSQKAKLDAMRKSLRAQQRREAKAAAAAKAERDRALADTLLRDLLVAFGESGEPSVEGTRAAFGLMLHLRIQERPIAEWALAEVRAQRIGSGEHEA